MKIQIFHNEIYVGNAELCIGVGSKGKGKEMRGIFHSIVFKGNLIQL